MATRKRSKLPTKGDPYAVARTARANYQPGTVPPEQCGTCEWCKGTGSLDGEPCFMCLPPQAP